MKITEKEFNVQTGEEIITEREETTAEKKFREAKAKEYAELTAQLEAKQKQKQAVAERLGLTADELQVLLG